MKQIEAVIQPFKLDHIKEAVSAPGAHGLTVCALIGLAAKGNALSPGRKHLSSFCPKSDWKLIVIDGIARAAAETVETIARIG
jgi:nitrogen regulatory protein PII